MKTQALFLVLLLSGCGPHETVISSHEAIINGESCTEQQFPASLELIRRVGESVASLCGATLIAPDVALTAAHCVAEFMMPTSTLPDDFRYYVTPRADMQTYSSEEFDSDSTTMIAVHAILMHGGYSQIRSPGPHHDMALLFLSRRSSIPPAQLITPQEANHLIPGLTAYIVGWGQQAIGLKGTVNTPPTKHCASTFVNALTQLEMQLGSSEYSAHKCFGDSGGATYVQFEPTVLGAAPPLRFAGVTSYGKDNDCRKGGFDTRVDAYYDWIQQTMQEGCEKGYRVSCD